MAASAWPNSSAVRGNFLSYSQLVSIQNSEFFGAHDGIIDKIDQKTRYEKRIWKASHPTFHKAFY